MEEEKEQSKFLKEADVAPLDGAEFFASEDWGHFLYKHPRREEKFLSTALSRAYEWLESLSGVEGTIFADPEKTRQKPYLKLVEFLKEKGLVRSFSLRNLRYNDAPPLSLYSIFGSYPPGMTDGEIVEEIGGYGYHQNPHIAFSKAIGEFLERYFSTVYLKRNLICGSFESLRERGGTEPIELTDLAMFSEEQQANFPEYACNEKSIFSWEKVRRPTTGKSYYVPAELVYWNYLRDSKIKEPHLREGNTSGCGGMFTEEGAILSALYEAVQRDAFLAFWLTLTPPPKIDPDSVPDDTFQAILRYAKRYGFEIHCMNTTLDTTLPSFVIMIEDTYSKWPCLSIGGGCEADPLRALCRALEESWGVYYWIRRRLPFKLPHPYLPFRTPLAQLERLRLAANHEFRNQYKFFWSGHMKKLSQYSFGYPENFLSKKDELTTALNRVERLGKGYEVYTYVSTQALLKEVGYQCARVLVPALLPLYLEERNAPLGSRRLKEIFSKMGKSVQKINSWPHPFG